MANPYDDATGITGATFEDVLTDMRPEARADLVRPLPPAYDDMGAAPTPAHDYDGFGMCIHCGRGNLEIGRGEAPANCTSILASSTPTYDSHRAMRIQGQHALNSLQAIVDRARIYRLQEAEWGNALDLLQQVSQILTELTK